MNYPVFPQIKNCDPSVKTALDNIRAYFQGLSQQPASTVTVTQKQQSTTTTQATTSGITVVLWNGSGQQPAATGYANGTLLIEYNP